jgi:hypothetical protein
VKFAGGPAAVVAFGERTHEAIAVAREGDVYRLDDDRATYGGRIPHTDPIAARISADAARAYVAFADGTIASLNLSGIGLKTLSCGCRPSGLDRVRSDVYRITEDPSLPLLFLDALRAEPRVRFVPVGQAELAQEAQ